MTEIETNITKWNEWKKWDTILLEKNDRYPEIGLLSLNRPDKLNAIDHTMIDDLIQAVHMLKREFDCRVLIICGKGKLFCSGFDLAPSAPDKGPHDWVNFPDKVKVFYQIQFEISSIFKDLRSIPQPVICAVHRAAAGGGMALANASDIVIASKETKFINAFIKIGLSGSDCASSYFLPRTIGFHRSAELLYTGRDLFAEEAYRWGYVNKVVETHEDVVPEAVKFASEFMLTKSPLGLRMTKEALNANIDAQNLESAIKLEDRNQTITGQTEDMLEGVMSFFEKRKPKYGSR